MPDTQALLDNNGSPIPTATYTDGSGRHHGKSVMESIEGGVPVPATTANPMPVETASRAALQNGAQVTVTTSESAVAAADATRVGLVIQHISGGAVRIGTTGVTTTTGMRLQAGDSPLVLSESVCPLNVVKGIAEATSAVLLVQSLTRV